MCTDPEASPPPPLSPGDRRPKGLRVHLVLPDPALVTEHHRIQEVKHVQVGYHGHRHILSTNLPDKLVQLILYPACTVPPPCGPEVELQLLMEHEQNTESLIFD